MYAIGDYLVHPGQGVCQVEDVKAAPDRSYVLLPLGQRHPIRISFPVESESRLRPVLSRQEAQQIIEEYPQLPPVSFEARNTALEEEHYKGEIRTGTCRSQVRIAKTFRERIDSLSRRNKKPPVAYERIMKQARERAVTELSVALGCTPEDVCEMFEERLCAQGRPA